MAIINPIVILLAAVTFFSTLLGGIASIKLRKILPYFFAFAAGSLIAVTFFDILPESLDISKAAGIPLRTIMTVLVASFLFYSLLEKFFLTHHHDDEGHAHVMGPIGAGSLVIHSFLDGAAIGAAYQVNPSIGLVVALAVIFHDFTDGINTVTVMLKNKHSVKNAAIFLALDAAAPVLGVLSTYFIGISEATLSLMLAFFAGEFLYLGATHLLPETHKHTGWKIIASMALGVAIIFTLTSLL